MPYYDRQCSGCGYIVEHLLERITADAGPTPCEKCGADMKRTIIGGTGLAPLRANAVIGDFCDVTVHNGICNPDGTPRRYTSKAEMAKEAAKRGLTNYVVHQPSKGSDKSRHTVRWT